MGLYDELSSSGESKLEKGDHLARLESADLKVAKTSGKEYLSLRFKLKSGQVLWHNLYFSEGALPMAIKQLKNLMLVESLPQYNTVQDLLADSVNFIRKTNELLMKLEGKKITLYCSGQDDQGRDKLFIKAYTDIPNEAIQKITKAPEQKIKGPEFKASEDIPW